MVINILEYNKLVQKSRQNGNEVLN